ncbi:MAG TPA: hypothetical protein VGD67_13800 [Pseudonocardiaceae bacterium]
MTVTLTHDPSLSRVRVTCDGLGDAVVATVQRSANGITWTTVRGGQDVAVAAGVLAAAVDDYEFAPDVINHYRVVYNATPSTPVAGTPAWGSNASVAPAIPPGTLGGDPLLCWAAIRNYGVGVPVTPAGWTELLNVGSARLYGKTAAGTTGAATTEPAPTVAFTGGVANATTMAVVVRARGLSLAVESGGAAGASGSAQNIAYPGVPAPAGGNRLQLVCAAKAAVSTGMTRAGWDEVVDVSNATGDDQSAAVYSLAQTTPAAVAAGSITVSGGVSAANIALTALMQPTTLTQTASTTPPLASVWVKFAGRPFLNRAVTVTAWSDVTQDARGGLFPVIGRSLPVAVTEVRGPRRWTVTLRANTPELAEELRLVFAGGDVTLIHVPAGCGVPGGWVHVDSVTITRRAQRAERRYLALAVTECAAPVPGITGATATWQTVVTTYATWADEIAAHATWADVLELVASPSEVISP